MRNINRIKPFLAFIEKAWEASPDLRFGQLLINLGLVENTFKTWNAEMEDYNLPHDVAREITSWGRYRGHAQTEIGLVPIHDQILIKDMDTDHIKAILKTQKHIKGKKIEKTLKEELKFRKFKSWIGPKTPGKRRKTTSRKIKR